MAKHRTKHTVADREVLTKSDAEIERETAEKWCARALACFRQFDKTGDRRWFARGVEYRHEAIEHAATAGSRVYEAIKKRLKGWG